jgi:hypothetical protein
LWSVCRLDLVRVDEAIRSAAWHYYRASILNLYGCGSPTSCTFCGAVSRGDEHWSLALGDYQQHQRTPIDRQDRLNLQLELSPAKLCPRATHRSSPGPRSRGQARARSHYVSSSPLNLGRIS